MKTEIQCNRPEQPLQMSEVQQNKGTNRGKGRDAGDPRPRALEEEEDPMTQSGNIREGEEARNKVFCDLSINCESPT